MNLFLTTSTHGLLGDCNFQFRPLRRRALILLGGVVFLLSVGQYRATFPAHTYQTLALSWSREFDDPIPLPNGRQLVTLQDAADYILKLPKAEQAEAMWQTAIACLIGAAEGRDFLMHARIGVLRALKRHVERVFDPSRKNTKWGKRKLARDR